MPPPPDTIDKAYQIMKASFITALTSNAADALIAGEVRASKLLRIPLNFNPINSRAVSATLAYREDMIRFGGSEVTKIIDGVPKRTFEPWLNDMVARDQERVAEIVQNAISKGTLPERELAEVFAAGEHNAKLTAYQETKALYNRGTMERYAHEHVLQGIWRHMDPQDNPREEHQELNGKTFDLDDPIWNELELFNCHCWCEPVLIFQGVSNLFNENQPRADNGRWSSGSGGGSTRPPGIDDKGIANMKRDNKKTWWDTPEVAAERIRVNTKSDQEFVDKVYEYVNTNVVYTDQGGSWNVRSPEAALKSGVGDCSERAQLAVKMLKKGGISANIVYGMTEPGPSGISHETVEYSIGGQTKILDTPTYPKFITIGYGKHPKERVIDE